MSSCTSSWYIGRCLYLTQPPACTCSINCSVAGETPEESEWKYPPCPFVSNQESCQCYAGKKPSNSGSVPPTDPGKGDDDDDDDDDDPNNPPPNGESPDYKNPITDVISCGKSLYECCCG